MHCRGNIHAQHNVAKQQCGTIYFLSVVFSSSLSLFVPNWQTISALILHQVVYVVYVVGSLLAKNNSAALVNESWVTRTSGPQTNESLAQTLILLESHAGCDVY